MVQADGAIIGTCECGGALVVPEGVFRAVGDTLEWIQDASLDELRHLLETAIHLRDEEATPEQARETLERESSRSGWSRLVPQSPADVTRYLGLLIGVIKIMIDLTGAGQPIDQEEVIDQVVDQLQEQRIQDEPNDD